MKKRIGRRLVSLLLTVVTVLTMLPAMTLPALAATSGPLTLTTNTSIGLSFTGNAEAPWSVNGEGIFGRVTSDKGTIRWHRYESTLTITNKKRTSATLSFDYTFVLNKGTITVDGNAPNGTFSKKLEPDESIEVYIKSGNDKGGTEITMTNVNLISETNPTVTFQPAENGSYTVDGKTINEVYTNTQSSMTAYQIVATPANGYQFLGWYDVSNEKYISTDAKTALNFDSDRTITARFASKTAALFETGGQPFDNLGDAVTYAQANSQNKITLASDGKITGTYTIPSGVTLLIPFDAAETLYTSEPGYVNTAETQKAYKTLTMAPGSSITVDGGAISVGGKHFAGSSGSCCKATGPYGQIIMKEGSGITLNNGANLYAWGYITGDGQITANSGATVYEYFQVMDWRGGQATLGMTFTKRVFPISQYYVQNIEAPLTIQNGATEKAYFSVDAAVVHTKSITIDFIGNDTSLFRLDSRASITKKYDPKTDRITYTTKGSASLDSLALSVAGYDIDSKDYVLPVNNNMTLEILSGRVAVNCNAALLPGAQITIAQGAELNIASGKSLYVYDYNTETNEWGKYCNGDAEFKPVLYSPTRTGTGTRTLTDAKIDVNGTLTAIGSVYTTDSGANICSSEGGGKFVQQSKPGTNSTTSQATQKGSDITYVSIPITAAKLKNVNGSYTETSGSNAGDTFIYCTCAAHNGGTWVQNLKVAAIIDGNGAQTGTYATLQEAVKAYKPDDSTPPKNYIQMLHSTTETIDASSNLYLDLNGCTVTGDFEMNGNTLYGMDSTTDAYDGTKAGKIVGNVSLYDKTTYQTPTVSGNVGDDAYKRYVAISGEENGTRTLSFHRFNISVSGYRFELATGGTPKCALFFIGKFQGDDAAKSHLASLGFTLKDNIDGTEEKYGCTITGKEIPLMPPEGEVSNSEVVRDADDAFLFEAYLMRDIDKGNSNTYQKPFTATAQATFDNGGKQSDPRELSFQEAWQNPGKITEEQQKILNSFLTWLRTPN